MRDATTSVLTEYQSAIKSTNICKTIEQVITLEKEKSKNVFELSI